MLLLNEYNPTFTDLSLRKLFFPAFFHEFAKVFIVDTICFFGLQLLIQPKGSKCLATFLKNCSINMETNEDIYLIMTRKKIISRCIIYLLYFVGIRLSYMSCQNKCYGYLWIFKDMNRYINRIYNCFAISSKYRNMFTIFVFRENTDSNKILKFEKLMIFFLKLAAGKSIHDQIGILSYYIALF